MKPNLILAPRRSLAAFLLVGGLAAHGHGGPSSPFEHSPNAGNSDPHPNLYPEPDFVTDGGVGYQWTVELGVQDSAFFTGHVGAWSWQDEALFDAAAGEEPVGWTHTSNWAFVTLKEACWLTVRLQRQAGVPWPSAENPARTASTTTMNPSFTLYAGYDGDGPDDHTYNNDGNVAWAEDLAYLAHVNNTTASFAEQSWFLPAGRYTLALGSNAPSNDNDRQGYRATLATSPAAPFAHTPNASFSDPDPNLYPEPDFITDGGVGYQWTVELGAQDTAFVTGHVGAWSWQDEALFDPAQGEPPVGWTHTSHWASVTLKEACWLSVLHSAAAGVPWPSETNPARLASTRTMGPSFTLFSGYDGDGPDNHTYNNHGPVAWAEDITYLAHVDNPTPRPAEGVWYLPAGRYTFALGSNAPSNDSDRQGYRTQFTTSVTEPAPVLRTARQGNLLTLFWRPGLAGYVLESAADAAFSAVQAEAVLDAAAGAREFNLGGDARFFRLRKPAS